QESSESDDEYRPRRAHHATPPLRVPTLARSRARARRRARHADSLRCRASDRELDEERRHLAATDEIVQLRGRRRRAAAIGGFEDLRDQLDVARGVEEEARTAEHEADRDIDVALLGARFVPGRRARRTSFRPWSTPDPPHRLDRPAAIDVADAEPAERLTDLVTRLGVGPLPGLRGEKEAVPSLAREPWRDAQLRIAVARRRVDVIEVVAKDELERAIGFGIGHPAQGRGAEERPAALVSGLPERRLRDHLASIVRARRSRAGARPS